jgi:cyclophilin family peptidyl-prolyl cis-trans isomerase
VALEAATIIARSGSFNETLALTGLPSPAVRLIALDELRARVLAAEGEARWAAPLLSTCEALLEDDPSEAVRREARALLIVAATVEPVQPGQPITIPWADAMESQDPLVRLQGRAQAARQDLMNSSEPRDRERLARLLAERDFEDRRLLNQLLEDPVPSVVAAALGALESRDVATLYHDRERLEGALLHDDPAIRGTVAEMMGPLIRDGNAPPWLVNAVADSLDQVATLPSPTSLEMEEARVSLARALGLPNLDPLPVSQPQDAPLLDRLIEERALARRDAAPRVILETSRGEVLLELDRLAAPRHVENFLELAEKGFYDGLDIHRVVPNFVVQGLDPRRDGWGVGGRRVPDEFGPDAYLTGSLGMPHAGSPQSGGCQIFITHLPTPHLDGAYTHFGRVVDGMDVVESLEIGDVIESVRRVPDVSS